MSGQTAYGLKELPLIDLAPEESKVDPARISSVNPPITPGRATVLEKTGTQSPGKFKHIEIEINVACDLACFACDRFSDVTTAPNMKVEQVKHFVKESLDLNWEWERIRILGGEPTIHPHIYEIVEALIEYRHIYPKCFIQLLSNGRGRLDRSPNPTNPAAPTLRRWLTYRGIDPHVEAKDPGVTPSWFNNTRLTPVDREPSVESVPPCGIFGVHGCGIGLTRHGYFLDGAGASIARVAGYDIGVMELKNLTWEAMLQQAKVLCRVCGHWNPDHTVITKKVTETGEITGAFWTEKLAAYKKSPPKLRVYGE